MAETWMVRACTATQRGEFGCICLLFSGPTHPGQGASIPGASIEPRPGVEVSL